MFEVSVTGTTALGGANETATEVFVTDGSTLLGVFPDPNENPLVGAFEKLKPPDDGAAEIEVAEGAVVLGTVAAKLGNAVLGDVTPELPKLN